MSQTEKDVLHPAATGLIGFGILDRMGKLRRRRSRAGKSAQHENPTHRSRTNIVSALLKAVVYAALFIVYLVAEVFVAMLIYMYLNLYHIEIFGRLIGLSRELLNRFALQLENLSPDLANQAYATILGELGAKSILLLFIGLIVSVLIRFLGLFLHNFLSWFFYKSVEIVRPQETHSS